VTVNGWKLTFVLGCLAIDVTIHFVALQRVLLLGVCSGEDKHSVRYRQVSNNNDGESSVFTSTSRGRNYHFGHDARSLGFRAVLDGNQRSG
jgi:hypothetical protein